jgi:competence protein ComEC
VAVFLFARVQLVWFCLICLGAFLSTVVYLHSFPGEDSISHQFGEHQLVEGDVVKSIRSDSSQNIILRDLIVNDIPVSGGIQLFIPLFPEYAYGDRIRLRCDLETPEPFDGFRYDRFLASKNIYATCRSFYAPLLVSSLEVVSIVGLRDQAIDRIDQIFVEPHASLLVGLLFGQQRFSDAWENRFQRTGTTHIVAASGYNVSVVAILVFSSLLFFLVRRQRAFLLIVLAIIGFVIVAGGEAAVLRAGVMAILLLSARQIGRKASMVNILMLTACVMLFVNPRLLRDDIGFQLSMASTIGLIYFMPVLEKHLQFISERYEIRASFAATVAATVATLPIILFSFGSFSVIGPLVNLIILPFIPYIMVLGSISVLISSVLPQLGILVALPAWSLLEFVLRIVHATSRLSFASILISGPAQIIFGILSVFFLIILCAKLYANRSRHY